MHWLPKEKNTINKQQRVYLPSPMFGQNTGAKKRVSFNMLFLAASSLLFLLSLIFFPKRLNLLADHLPY